MYKRDAPLSTIIVPGIIVDAAIDELGKKYFQQVYVIAASTTTAGTTGGIWISLELLKQ